MVSTRISSIMNINNRCDINVKSDDKNTFKYELWEKNIDTYNKNINVSTPNIDWEDNFEYCLAFTDGSKMDIVLKAMTNMFDNKTILIMTKYIKYKFAKDVHGFNQQIPMIKLFMSVYMSRKYIKYCRLNNGAIQFTFYLYNKKTECYDKQINLIVDTKIIVDKANKPIVIESESMLDHLILKAFIKLSNIMKINIKNINVNSLVGACRGGYLYKVNIDQNVNINSLDHTIDDLLNNANKDMVQKINQCSWVSDNIIRAISGEDTEPYNCYADMIFNMHKKNMLLGITIGNSFMYIINNMKVGECGSLTLGFHNLFNCKDIDVSFQNVIHGMNQIGIIVTNKSDIAFS